MEQKRNQQQEFWDYLLRTSDRPGYASAIGIEIKEIGEGFARGELAVTPELANPFGVVHGGALVGLADTVCGYAATSLGVYCVTSSSQISYIRPAKGSRLFCSARVRKSGGHLCVMTAEISNDLGQEVALGTFEFYILGKVDPAHPRV